MLLTIAESGERKTSVQNPFFMAIEDLNTQAFKTGKEELDFGHFAERIRGR